MGNSVLEQLPQLVAELRHYNLSYHMTTPEELRKYDPYGLIWANIARHNHNADGQQCPITRCFGTPEAWFEAYQSKLLTALQGKGHDLYWDFNASYSSKYGPQGGSVRLVDAIPSIAKYYAAVKFRKHPILDAGKKALIRRIREIVSRVGYLAEIPPDGEHVKGTWAGIPTGLSKGGYLAETERCSMHLQHLDPSVVGFRKARNSLRVIYQDATSNVRQTNGVASAVLNWLRTYMPEYFGAWLNPRKVVNPIATRQIERGGLSIEFDYEKCDQHFSKQLMIEYVLPIIAEILGPRSGEFISFACLAEEYFEVPLYLGYVMLTGVHNLFSGQTITQLIETIFDIVLQLGLVEWFGLYQTLHLAVGDDQALLLKQHDIQLARDVTAAGIEASETAGLPMNTEKCDIRDRAIAFCKRLYYVGGVRCDGQLLGAYPSVLTLNAVINPEFSSNSLGESLLATASRVDNLYGSPEFVPFAQFIGKRIDKGVNYTDADLAAVNRKDWWQKIYGEAWNPESSQTFRIWSQSNLI